MHSFEDLEVWKSARIFRKQCSKSNYSVSTGRKKQVNRSDHSIITFYNGKYFGRFGRFHHQENIQFYRTARASLTETLDHLICAIDRNYISTTDLEQLRLGYDHCLKLLNGYISYLKKAKLNSIT